MKLRLTILLILILLFGGLNIWLLQRISTEDARQQDLLEHLEKSMVTGLVEQVWQTEQQRLEKEQDLMQQELSGVRTQLMGLEDELDQLSVSKTNRIQEQRWLKAEVELMKAERRIKEDRLDLIEDYP